VYRCTGVQEEEVYRCTGVQEEEVYRTWPDRSRREAGEVTGSASVHHLPPTQPMTMAAALESLNISYSPGSQCLQATVATVASVESDENEGQHIYYKPGHRKAYSLPRSLEGGSKVEHDVVLESPRTTLERYGLQYQPWSKGAQPGLDLDCSSSFSEDSGVFSQSQSEASVRSGQARRGLGEMISKGLAANLRLLSRSGQQMVRLVRKEVGEGGEVQVQASSQSLIMEGRPAGVPAKTAAEEERHRLEHSQLVEKVKRKEQWEGRSRAERLAEQRRAEDDLSQLTSHWQTNILPGWASLATSKKTLSLWWRGLPPPVRGKVWRLALPNSLNLTAQLYHILVRRARDQLEGQPGPGLGREQTLELIRLDVSRTFPALCIFQSGGPYYNLLHNVLGAYVCYRPDIGYVQGMSFIAAILILNMDEADAFITFANLLNWPRLAAFFCVDQDKMSEYYSSFSSQLSAQLPALAAHFSRLGLRSDLYLLDWLMTLFSRCLPLDVTCRIWDLIFRDGETFLIKAALGILALYEDRLLAETDFVLIAQFLSKLPDDINSDLLFDKIEGLSSSSTKRTFPSLSLW